MAASDPQDNPIPVRCPSCGTRFEAAEDLRGSVVECGKCSHRFEILDAVIVRGRKYYPGEKRDSLLDHVAKINKPLPSAQDMQIADAIASQSSPPPIGSISPQKVLLAILSVFAVVVTALLLMVGSKPGGALEAVSAQNRVVIASFVALLSTGMLIYSNTRSWFFMLLIGLGMGGGLIALPLRSLIGASDDMGDVNPDSKPRRGASNATPVTYSMEQLREMIGTEPLEKERQRLLDDGSNLVALGLWLRNLNERNLLLIKEYVIREMNAAPDTHPYPRGRGEFLMVVTGIREDLERLAEVAKPLGKVKAIHESVYCVEVDVDNSNFETGPIERLTDPKDLQFYQLNAVELKSIDINRVSSSLKRLSEVEPVLLRDDIRKRLVDLLSGTWYEDKGEVCRALLAWGVGGEGVGRVALDQAVIIHSKEEEIPVEMIALCIQHQETDVLPLLYELWKSNPTKWEPWFREAGEPSEKVILLGFDDTSGILKLSACRILGQIGSKLSLPVLRVTEATAEDAETRTVARTSIQLIEKRIEATGQ